MRIAALAIAFAAAAASPALAQERWALGVELGLTGPGVTAAYRLADRVSLRAGFAGIAAEIDDDETAEPGGVDYRSELDLAAGGLYIDRYLGETQLRLVAGVVYVSDRIDLTAALRPGVAYPIGGGTYGAAEIGALTGRSTVSSPGAYLGFGWGNPFAGSSRWRFRAEIGAIYHEGAEVTLDAENPGGSPALDADVAREADALADDLGRFRPVLTVGVSFRF